MPIKKCTFLNCKSFAKGFHLHWPIWCILIFTHIKSMPQSRQYIRKWSHNFNKSMSGWLQILFLQGGVWAVLGSPRALLHPQPSLLWWGSGSGWTPSLTRLSLLPSSWLRPGPAEVEYRGIEIEEILLLLLTGWGVVLRGWVHTSSCIQGLFVAWGSPVAALSPSPRPWALDQSSTFLPSFIPCLTISFFQENFPRGPPTLAPEAGWVVLPGGDTEAGQMSVQSLGDPESWVPGLWTPLLLLQLEAPPGSSFRVRTE